MPTDGDRSPQPGARSDTSRPRALIAYGTSRGSTERIGEAIAQGIEAGGGAASALRTVLVREMPEVVEAADVVGVGSPVYWLREPSFMTEFLTGLPSLEGKRAFVFCTCGMDLVGETLARLHTALSERGAVVVGAEHFRSSMSYLPHRKRGLGNPLHLPDEEQLTAARRFGERMARAAELEPIPLESISSATRWKARLLGSKRLRRVVFPQVRLDESACTGYGACLTRCSFVGLDREDEEGIPFFTDACVNCLECIDSCPRSALRVDSRVKEWISTLSYRLGIH